MVAEMALLRACRLFFLGSFLHAVGAHLDETVRLGACGLPTLKAFSCADLPDWKRFLKQAQLNAKDGYPSDANLFEQANRIVVNWEPHLRERAPPEGFLKYLCGGSEAQWPMQDSFCLYGYFSALVVRARHMMLSDNIEHRRSADIDFEYAATILGREAALDFLSSSPLPYSLLDVYLNINQTTFDTFESYASRVQVQAPRVAPESIYWQVPPVVQETRCRRPLLAAVFGTHATLTMEPLDMLGRVEAGSELHGVFYGLQPKWCESLGLICGDASFQHFLREQEDDPHAFPWDLMLQRVEGFYRSELSLQKANFLICTEPVAVCLMLIDVAAEKGHKLPMLMYLGVALLQGCPPTETSRFWSSLEQVVSSNGDANGVGPVLAVNNLILSEQIFYQSGIRFPYVRAHGLHTDMVYSPLRGREVLFWRAPLFGYMTMRCAIERFLDGLPTYPLAISFMDEGDHVEYKQAAQYRAVALTPWDHALMVFYELYSACMPLLLPSREWMYRLLYQRGQLSVGEPFYRSGRPGYEPPLVEYAEDDAGEPGLGFSKAAGFSAARAARGAAEHTLERAVAEDDLESMRQLAEAARGLLQDMNFFLAVAENRTGEEDVASSLGVVRRRVAPDESSQPEEASRAKPSRAESEPWHPYTPFQMSTRDSNDWTRMRKGTWWLRRGVRFDAMRYWYQFSDFARFPGLQRFSNLPELLCMARDLDLQGVAREMERYNQETLHHSALFWTNALGRLTLGMGF